MNKTKSIIGTQVNIEYFDQNDSFASLLPRRGTIVRQLRSEKGVDDWFLIRIDDPFDYQINNPNSFSLLHCENILIRSRWKGYKIGETEPTSVFILLIPDDNLLNNEVIKVEQFYHIAWGMCYSERE